MRSFTACVLLSLFGMAAANGQCETAWVRGPVNTCFLELEGITRWGWTNTIKPTVDEMGNLVPEVYDVYAGAGQCKLSAAALVGDATVTFVGGVVTVSVSMRAGWVAKGASLHVGHEPLHIEVKPKGSSFSAAPGLFPYQSQSPPHVFNVVVEQGHESLYLALHVDVCTGDGTVAPTPAPTTAEPTPEPPTCEEVANTAVRVEEPHIMSDAQPKSVSEGMDGWTLAGRTPSLHDFYDVQLRPGMRAHFPQQTDALPAGTRLRIHCPANCEGAPCEAVVTVYHCPPCSKDHNGGYPALLPVHAWAPGRCAPHFKYADKDSKYNMVGFYKVIPAGTVEELPATTAKLSNVAVFARTNAVNCDGFKMEGECSANSDCKWEGAECISSWCPLAPPAPTAGTPPGTPGSTPTPVPATVPGSTPPPSTAAPPSNPQGPNLPCAPCAPVEQVA